jgi:hypothetical protein
MDAAAALELLRPELGALVLLDGEGHVEASTVDDAEPLARAVTELLGAAAALRSGGRHRIERLSVEAPGGFVFAVAVGDRTLAAAAGPDATPALALHDLARTLAELDGDAEA